MRSALTLTRLAVAVALALPGARALADPVAIGVHPIWFAGVVDADRDAIDAFLDCVVHGSDTNRYWRGEAALVAHPSHLLAPPGSTLPDDPAAVASWLGDRVAAGDLPAPPAGEIPLYLLFGGPPAFAVSACGLAGTGDVAGRHAGVARVRNVLPCWATGDILRTETQIAFHELVETADALLGYAPCAADGACEGQGDCADPCDTFVGLTCPGAPVGSWTGCGGGRVDGWVVQKLSYEGRDEAACQTCVTCGFTPRACGPDDPDCASVPSTPAPPAATSARAAGCASGLAPGAPLALLAALLGLAYRRARRAAP